MKFWILCSGYNCENYIEACCNSILSQTDQNFEAILIDDGSTDKTRDILFTFPVLNKFRVYSQPANKGRCYHFWMVLRKMTFINDEDVIICLGMDDRLEPNAIEIIKKQYENGAWFTYGNWKDQHGNIFPIEDIPISVFTDKSYRKSKWVTTAPQTFKKFLFNNVNESDLQYPNGKWLDTCTDLALTFPILEQCPADRIRKISEPIYVYNMNRSQSTLKRLGRAYKTKAREYLKTMSIKSYY